MESTSRCSAGQGRTLCCGCSRLPGSKGAAPPAAPHKSALSPAATACRQPRPTPLGTPPHCCRPPLLSPLSPLLPRLPGDGDDRLAPTRGEPPLLATDFAAPPPPIPCQPLAPEVQQRLAAGQGMLVALDGFKKHSQLAWCLEEQERQRQVGVAAEAASGRIAACALCLANTGTCCPSAKTLPCPAVCPISATG